MTITPRLTVDAYSDRLNMIYFLTGFTYPMKIFRKISIIIDNNKNFSLNIGLKKENRI